MSKHLLKVKPYSCLLLLIFLLGSCSKNGTEVKQTTIGFNAVIDDQTRAYGTIWEEGDHVGLFCTKSGYTLAENYTYKTSNKSFNVAVNGTMTPTDGSPTYYAPNSEPMDFYTYYPYSASKVSNGKYSMDISDQSSLRSIDFMWAKVLNKSTSRIDCNFQHQLAKITLNLTPGGANISTLTGLTATLMGEYKTASFDLKTGIITPNTIGNIPLAVTQTSGTTTITALVIPSSGTTSRKIMFSVGTQRFLWAIDDNIQWIGGKSYIYNVVVGHRDV